MDQKIYDIEGQSFYQVPVAGYQGLLVWELFVEIFGPDNRDLDFDHKGLVKALQPQFDRALALLLIPERMTRVEFVDYLENPVQLEQARTFFKAVTPLPVILEALSDFFVLTDIFSIKSGAEKLFESMVSRLHQASPLSPEITDNTSTPSSPPLPVGVP